MGLVDCISRQSIQKKIVTKNRIENCYEKDGLIFLNTLITHIPHYISTRNQKPEKVVLISLKSSLNNYSIINILNCSKRHYYTHINHNSHSNSLFTCNRSANNVVKLCSTLSFQNEIRFLDTKATSSNLSPVYISINANIDYAYYDQLRRRRE